MDSDAQWAPRSHFLSVRLFSLEKFTAGEPFKLGSPNVVWWWTFAERIATLAPLVDVLATLVFLVYKQGV